MSEVPEFDAYLMVDWSANNTPKRGKDSIWYCLLEHSGSGVQISELENPPTRSAAGNQIVALLTDLAGRERATLVGFDFAYGYPVGFAQALGGSSWCDVWSLLSARVTDEPSNCSNRFEVAAELNRICSGQAFPFWGCPSDRQASHLTSTRSLRHTADGLAEFRTTEQRIRGPQAVWKLCYPGSVGSQAMLGIPYVRRLRFGDRLAGQSVVWPFETGFELAPRSDRQWLIMHAEIYPSIRKWHAAPGQCNDQAQVYGLAAYFAELDEAGQLTALFERPADLSESEVHAITTEEGWILGIH